MTYKIITEICCCQVYTEHNVHKHWAMYADDTSNEQTVSVTVCVLAVPQ